MQYPSEYPSAPVTTAPSKPSRAVPFTLFLATVALSIFGGVLMGVAASAQLQPKPVNPQTSIQTLQEQEAYGRVIAIDYPLEIVNGNLGSNDCSSAGSITNCEVDLHQLAKDDNRFVTDLKALKVPACLAAANALFLQGLPEEAQGATLEEQAIRTNDAGKGSEGSGDMAKGFAAVEQAMIAYKAATC